MVLNQNKIVQQTRLLTAELQWWWCSSFGQNSLFSTDSPPSADFNWRCRLRQNKFCVKTACFCFSPEFPENGSVLPAVSATPNWPPRKHVSHPSLTQSSIHFHFLFNYSIRGSYFCVPLNSDTGFNSLSLSLQSIEASSLLGWKQANKKQFDEKGDAGDLGIILWGQAESWRAFLAGCLHQSPSLDHFQLFKEPILSCGNYIFPFASFLLIVKRVNFAHKALSRPAGCRSSNAMSRCFNLHQKCHCQLWDRTWYLYIL